MRSSRAQRLLWTSPSKFEMAEYHFYGALSHAASCESAAAGQRRQHVEALAAHHRQLEIWAANCPENFENRAALVGAEIARIEGRALDAMELYEQAIRSARANGFVHNEALAYELAARFYAARGFDADRACLSAERPLRLSALGSRRQGAATRRDVSAPQEEEPVPDPTSTIGAPVEHLDLATVIKVSQAVSGEIVLEKLIDTLMRTAIEQAGAERGLLILSRGAEPRIEAEATTGGDTVIVQLRDQPVTAAVLPETVLHYVLRTRESVILDDAASPAPVCRGSLHPRAPGAVHSLPALDHPGQAHRRALSREQPGPPRLRAGPDRGAEAARLAGGDRAGEYPFVPRSRTNAKPRSGAWSTPTSSGSSSGISTVGLSRPMTRFCDMRGIRPRGSRLGPHALDGSDAAGMARPPANGPWPRARGDRELQPFEKEYSAKTAAACRC